MKVVLQKNGVIVLKVNVPLYNSRYSKSSNDPVERILRKLKERFIENRNLAVTHLISRTKDDEILIQFLISNFNNKFSSTKIMELRKEYAEVALKVLAPYVAYIAENQNVGFEDLEKAEGTAIAKIAELVPENPIKSRQAAERLKRKIAFKERDIAKAGLPYEAKADPMMALIADGIDPERKNIGYIKSIAMALIK